MELEATAAAMEGEGLVELLGSLLGVSWTVASRRNHRLEDRVAPRRPATINRD